MSAAAKFQLDWRDAVVLSFRYHKNIAERAIAQISDEALHRVLDANVNSIAVIMKHVGGNLRSRWVDFLTSDGEKPWRNRDDEFVDNIASRQEAVDVWEAGWAAVLGSLEALGEEDFDRTVTIRGEAHSVALATERSLAHTSYHVGQIVMLARHWAGDTWESLTIARGASAVHNQNVWGAGDYVRRST